MWDESKPQAGVEKLLLPHARFVCFFLAGNLLHGFGRNTTKRDVIPRDIPKSCKTSRMALMLAASASCQWVPWMQSMIPAAEVVNCLCRDRKGTCVRLH